MKRPWTGKELHQLRQLRQDGRTYAECATILGRTQAYCSRQAYRCNMSRPVGPRLKQRRSLVPKMHASGLTPWEMHKKRPTLGTHTAFLNDHKVLGLTPHRIDRAERGRRGQKANVRRNGVNSGAYYRERERVVSALDGWPFVSRISVFHLDVFYRLGPTTSRAHCVRSGRALENGIVYDLAAAGHLVAVGGIGRATIYDLAPAVRDRRRQAIAYQSPNALD